MAMSAMRDTSQCDLALSGITVGFPVNLLPPHLLTHVVCSSINISLHLPSLASFSTFCVQIALIE